MLRCIDCGSFIVLDKKIRSMDGFNPQLSAAFGEPLGEGEKKFRLAVDEPKSKTLTRNREHGSPHHHRQNFQLHG